MQLRLQPRTSKTYVRRKLLIKTISIVLVLFLAIFLLDKIEVSAPTKLIKQKISNDKIITLK